MKTPPADLDGESWAFALEVYARPGVSDACLKLQNEAGVDVLMLLAVTFAAIRLRVLLTPAEITELDNACRPWREQIIRPLRAIRTGLKSGPAPAPSNDTEQLRSKIKVIELNAERLQNQLLAACLPRRPAKPDSVNADELRSVLRSVTTLFLEKHGNKPNSDLLSTIDTIADAVMHGAC
jgi:uncharacterized protein (TIGR02444 family)